MRELYADRPDLDYVAGVSLDLERSLRCFFHVKRTELRPAGKILADVAQTRMAQQISPCVKDSDAETGPVKDASSKSDGAFGDGTLGVRNSHTLVNLRVAIAVGTELVIAPFKFLEAILFSLRLHSQPAAEEVSFVVFVIVYILDVDLENTVAGITLSASSLP